MPEPHRKSIIPHKNVWLCHRHHIFFLPLCQRLLGNLGFIEQAHPSWSCLAAGCSALPQLYEERAYALIPVVPKESRMCWAQLFSWLSVDGWEDQSRQPRGDFLQGAGSTTVLPVAARGKFGKPLGEHSGLPLTVTCFGIGKGWRATIALGWWKN